ncbi:hypothetical protein AJ79_01247 [Helicocarpus griseus UAMH5409]|uniref:Zn(2)-C6 fungal-type domain-containing protein n=1 Tax=Helicocarpus griseus UAMH5409 TaxID=1447875 RepID=A0A2B7Y8L0_9EURO|nr:hypothetical protein AJ79_01247 [Helicocarpus griseus UAMH5409]
MPSEGVPKCQRCRKDHKRCSPDVRPWPGPKCDRCESYGYECSENMMARRSSQRDAKSARAVNRAVDNRLGGYHQNPTRSLSTRPSQPLVIGSMPGPELRQSPFVGLFMYLKCIDWANLSCSPALLGSDPFAAVFRSPTCLPDLLGPPLGKRQMYLEVFNESERLKQSSAQTLPYDFQLETSVVTAIVTRLQQEQPRRAMNYSVEELSRMCATYINYGNCWNKLRMALDTEEVLLIDPTYSFDKPHPEVTFDTAVRIWLYQIPGLKELCQRLSGLNHMILNLARAEPNSTVRAYLALKIGDRLDEVLGPGGVASTSPLYSIGTNNNDSGSSYNDTPFLTPATIGGSPVELRDGGSDDSSSFDDSSLQAGFGGGYGYQGPWGS